MITAIHTVVEKAFPARSRVRSFLSCAQDSIAGKSDLNIPWTAWTCAGVKRLDVLCRYGRLFGTKQETTPTPNEPLSSLLAMSTTRSETGCPFDLNFLIAIFTQRVSRALIWCFSTLSTPVALKSLSRLKNLSLASDSIVAPAAETACWLLRSPLKA